jgi:tetratricopeptide (TPR) repeat protein
LNVVNRAAILFFVKNLNTTYFLTLVVTIGLFIFAGFESDTGMWGINHLEYLSGNLKIGIVSLLLLGIVSLLLLSKNNKLDKAISLLSSFILGPIWQRLIIVFLFSAAFYLLRIDTFFLGDGYTLISVMGQGKVYLQRWTVPGSTFLFRIVQDFFGGYTEKSAINAFQFLSVLSGSIVIFNLIGISKRLFDNNNLRLLALSTAVFSGTALLFFGYVEFYPLYWLTATTFVLISLRYLKTHRGLFLVLLTFIVSVLTHLQSLIMIGGLVAIICYKLFGNKGLQLNKRIVLISLVTFVAIGAAGLFSIRFMPEFFTMKLPMFTGSEELNRFSVYGIDYLLDVLNEMLLILPGILVLFSLGAIAKPKNIISFFLFMAALGSLGWILLIDPTLGIGRDWDLLAMPFFLVGLFAVWGISKNTDNVTSMKVLAYSWTCFIIASTFVCVNVISESSEARFVDLVRRYEDKDYTGWAVLSNYYLVNGDEEKLDAISKEMSGYFPTRGLLRRANYYLMQNQIDSAIVAGKKALRYNPTDHQVLIMLGTAYKSKGDYEQAEMYFREAMRVFPHSGTVDQLAQLYLHSSQLEKALETYKEIIADDPQFMPSLEGLGLTYYRMGYADSALAIADSIFAVDKNSPGGHLLKMFVYINRDESNKAAYHYREYVKYGKNRQEYPAIVEQFKQMK